MFDLSDMIAKHPGLRAIADRFPLFLSLEPLMGKKVGEIDLADLNLVRQVFGGTREMTRADVDNVQRIVSCTTADELADLYSSPEAAMQIVRFFTEAGGPSDVIDDEGAAPILPISQY